MEDRTRRLAKLNADRQWKIWVDRQLVLRKLAQQKLDSAGAYVGYDADSETHEIQLLSGRNVAAKSITTSGQTAGQRVVVSRAGGQYRFKTTPR